MGSLKRAVQWAALITVVTATGALALWPKLPKTMQDTAQDNSVQKAGYATMQGVNMYAKDEKHILQFSLSPDGSIVANIVGTLPAVVLSPATWYADSRRQDVGNASLASIDGKITAVDTSSLATEATAAKIVGALGASSTATVQTSDVTNGVTFTDTATGVGGTQISVTVPAYCSVVEIMHPQPAVSATNAVSCWSFTTGHPAKREGKIATSSKAAIFALKPIATAQTLYGILDAACNGTEPVSISFSAAQ